jgi:hypothetical protein
MKVNDNKIGQREEGAKIATKFPCQDLHYSSSRLLELPQEMRDEIYSWVFSSTRVTFGEVPGVNRRIKPTINKSRVHNLALLCICQQITAEIGLRWISWVLFNFQSPESLLDVLTKAPTSRVAAIHHIRVNGRPIRLWLPNGDLYYGLAWILKLVPHLQLHTLTVLGGYVHYIAGRLPEVDYNTIDELITYGTGWKELHYVAPDSSCLSFQKADSLMKTCFREPQPDGWRLALSQRDGPDSGASVVIYRSRTSIAGSIIKHHEREIFEQHVAPQLLENCAQAKDPLLTLPNEQCKEVLIVAKRGRHANIMEEVSQSPYGQDYDIRTMALNMTWPQIREDYTEGGGYDHSDGDVFGMRLPRRMDKLDIYGNHAYEIDWYDI